MFATKVKAHPSGAPSGASFEVLGSFLHLQTFETLDLPGKNSLAKSFCVVNNALRPPRHVGLRTPDMTKESLWKDRGVIGVTRMND